MDNIKIDLDGHKISLKHILKNKETYKINDREKVWSLTIYKSPQRVRGATSLCQDNKHVLFIDWDDTCKWIVENELKELAKDYAPFYLFATKQRNVEGELVGNYHAICLQKFYPNEILNIQIKTSCDSAYTTMPLRNRYRSWVLRMSDKKGSGKPKFVRLIGDSNLNKEVSLAHLKLLNVMYKLPKIDYQNKDNFTKIYFNEYETG